jgi:cytochrome P450
MKENAMADPQDPASITNETTDGLLADKDAFFGHGAVVDPYPELATMLSKCPVHAGSIQEHFGVGGPETLLFGDSPQVSVLSFDGVENGFKNYEELSARWYKPSLSNTFGRTILEMDPPEHGRYRQLIQGALTRKEMERWETEFVRDLVNSFLDSIAARGKAELVKEFAIQYPLRVLVEACELPQDDVEMFYTWAAMLTNVGVEEQIRIDVAAKFGAYLLKVINERRSSPGKDLVSLLATATFRKLPGSDEPGGHLTDEEIVSFLRLLLPAGAQTTYRTLCNLLVGLLTHPDQLAAIYEDHSLIPQAIEEGLRWEPPLISFGREAVVDTEIEGVSIAAGTQVNLVVAAADRDPSRWDNPDEFDIFRPQIPHVAFGTGNHVCLGIHFARMELRVAMEQIVKRLPNLRIDPDYGDVTVEGLGARSPDLLHVLFDAEPREGSQ